MGLRVATNVQSLAAQRHLGKSNEMQKASLEKLASGTRIVRAADDAAGLAIAEKMRAQIRSVRQDIRNANDGVSLVQVAEGGMNEAANILVRMRELSIQGASDTISDNERGFINKEVEQLGQEVDRISRGIEFSGTKLLNGEGSVLEIQVGANNDPAADRFSIDVSQLNTTSAALGIEGISTLTKEESQANLDRIDNGIRLISENRSTIGALQNRLQSTISNLGIYDENLSAARSRIYDVDIASESAELTKTNILATAGTSVLSQANQNSTLALKLLG